MKRWMVAMGAALATVAAIGLVAPAANAGIDKPLIYGSLAGTGVCWMNGDVGQDEITITGNPGDSFVFVNVSCGAASVLVPSLISGPNAIVYGSRGRYTLGNTLGTATMLVRTLNGNLGVNIVVTSVPVVTPVAVVHDTLQQVGVPASGDCADVPPTVGHYHDFPIGGWGKSWAKWIYNGTGGPVCSRELYVNSSSGEWQIVGQS